MTLPAYFTQDDDADAPTTKADRPRPDRNGWAGVQQELVAALIIGIVGLLLRLSTSSTRSVNGLVTQCSYIDFSAWIGAALVLALTGVAVYKRMRQPGTRMVAGPVFWVLTATAIGIGLYLVLRGLGMVDNPCLDLVGTVID